MLKTREQAQGLNNRSMELTVERLIRCGIGPTPSKVFCAALWAQCVAHDITTAPRIAAFIAQIAHESSGLQKLEENLWYTSASRLLQLWPQSIKSVDQAAGLIKNPKQLASVVYANKLGNGSVASSDGWNYRGRGFVQLTGRTNYRNASSAIGIDFVTQPALVAGVAGACATSTWYWSTIGANNSADAGDFDGITRRITGPALTGLRERNRWHAACKAVFR